MAALDDRIQHEPGSAGVGAPARWSLRLLGDLQATSATQTLSRWPSRAAAALLARLALAPERAHSREELVELLWPGVSPSVGRNRLRQTLSSLKSLLEPAAAQAEVVIAADRLVLRVVPGTLSCDAHQFERLVRAGRFQAARPLYRGELMPGHFDDWVIEERRRLATLFERVEAASALAPAPQDRLPNYWTRSFGVEHTATRLQAQVNAHRLVTVHGPGGSGKTRLAVATARALMGAGGAAEAGHHPLCWERIVFVSLIDRCSAGQCLDAICGALSLNVVGDPQQALLAALDDLPTLLVLDNLEQLLAEAEAAIAALLTALPRLHVLATSRRLLELDGEVAFELDGLPLPQAHETLDAAAINPAVALFVDRARAARADFHFGAPHGAAIQSLVRLLAGMPLAIELAASKMRSLNPTELLQRLRDEPGSPSLDLLSRSGGRAAADTRHASMRHVVAWSWQQLAPELVVMMQTLAVCVAPVRVDAAAAMADVSAARAQAWLDELCDASLLRPIDAADGVTRLAMLQPVREFAAETSTAAAARAARGRLRVWLLEHCAAVAGRGPGSITSELPHVFSAITSAEADGAGDDAMRLAMALRAYWDGNGMPLPVLLALECAVAADGERDLRSDILELLSQCRTRAGFSSLALQHAESGLGLVQGERRRSLALTRWAVAHYLSERHDVDFDAALNEAVALAERSNDLEALARAVRAQAAVASGLKRDHAEAERLTTLNQAQWEQLGNTTLAQAAVMSRFAFWTELGRSEEAHAGALLCERQHLASGEWTMVVTALWVQGLAAIKLRRWPAAVAALRRCCGLASQHEFAQGLAHGLLRLPEALLHAEDAEAAARLQGFAPLHWARLYQKLTPVELRNSVRTRRLLRLRLGAQRAEALRSEGQGMSVAQAVQLALGECQNPTGETPR